MSLLMDALKMAEKENSKRQAAATDASSTPAAELHAETTSAPHSVDSRGSLELMDDEFFSAKPSPTTKTGTAVGSDDLPSSFATAATEPERPPILPSLMDKPSLKTPSPTGEANAELEKAKRIAQNVFNVGEEPKAVRKNFILVTALATILSFTFLGIYVWYNLPSSKSWAVARANTGSALSTPATTSTPSVAVAPAPDKPGTLTPTPSLANSQIKPTIAPVMPVDTIAVAKTVSAKKAVTGSASSIASAAKPKTNKTASLQSNQLSISSNLSVSPLDQGYKELQAGNLDAAEKLFNQAREKAKGVAEIPALFGLAAVSLQRGQAWQAAQYYLRVLELDPQNTTSEAALLGLRGQLDPTQIESRLKALLSRDKNLPLPNFLLGNLYAQQNRWREAQAAYFDAYSLDAENPDYAYNLAVSLDHLRQSDLARKYYRIALDARQSRLSRFDPALAKTRLQTLEQ